jgi:hypothetical protein
MKKRGMARHAASVGKPQAIDHVAVFAVCGSIRLIEFSHHIKKPLVNSKAGPGYRRSAYRKKLSTEKSGAIAPLNRRPNESLGFLSRTLEEIIEAKRMKNDIEIRNDNELCSALESEVNSPVPRPRKDVEVVMLCIIKALA